MRKLYEDFMDFCGFGSSHQSSWIDRRIGVEEVVAIASLVILVGVFLFDLLRARI
jgi:hypothetical protein